MLHDPAHRPAAGGVCDVTAAPSHAADESLTSP